MLLRTAWLHDLAHMITVNDIASDSYGFPKRARIMSRTECSIIPAIYTFTYYTGINQLSSFIRRTVGLIRSLFVENGMTINPRDNQFSYESYDNMLQSNDKFQTLNTIQITFLCVCVCEWG